MAVALDVSEGRSYSRDYLSGTSRTNIIDRWIYVFTAAVLIAVVFAGFIPDSLAKVAAIDAGKRPPFPLVLHLHATLMGSFLLLLLAQTVLVATERRGLHMQLGIAAAVLVPAIVVTGFVLTPTMYQPDPVLDDILLLQIRAGILFPIYMWIALRSRKQAPGSHKRMVILAITPVLGAAVARITWLPTTFPSDALALDIYTLLPFLPMFVWDAVRNRTVHRAYLVWAGFFLPVTVLLYALWNTPWWHETARRLMGA